MAEHVGGPLGHQDLDLVHGAAELQVAQVESGGEPVGAAPLVRQNVLKGRNRNGLNQDFLSGDFTRLRLTCMVMMRMSRA